MCQVQRLMSDTRYHRTGSSNRAWRSHSGLLWGASGNGSDLPALDSTCRVSTIGPDTEENMDEEEEEAHDLVGEQDMDMLTESVRSTLSETALYDFTCVGVVGCAPSSLITTRLLDQTAIVPSPFQYLTNTAIR
jgi:hypothetical protein